MSTSQNSEPPISESARQFNHGKPAKTRSKRYHSLDGARSLAMLLGVFYHLPIAMMAGMMTIGFGAGMNTSPKTSIDNWLHSFRMPLFFLISGIFAAMMLGKYGIGRYMRRRWWRIGMPFVVAFFALVGFRYAQNTVSWLSPYSAMQPSMPVNMAPYGASGYGGDAMPGFAGPADFGGGMAPAYGGAPDYSGAPSSGLGETGNMNMPADEQMNPFMPIGDVPGFGDANFSALLPELPGGPSHGLAEKFFGNSASMFNLEHLWFLWYLLIFVTVAPLVAFVCGQIVSRVAPGFWKKIGNGIYHAHLVPVLLALISLPALMNASGYMGWSLTNPIGFSASFPDFLFQYDHADLPYYFIWFMTGWWLFSFNHDFKRMGRSWRWNILIGIAGFAISQMLFQRYGDMMDPGQGGSIRAAGFALYGLGSACTAFGLLGFFERFLDRPSKAGRYFTDAMLWVYLIHLPLIPYVINWIEPARSAWWVSTLAGMVLVTGISLILYELIVRPTPLVHIFGPPQMNKKSMADVAAPASETRSKASTLPNPAPAVHPQISGAS